VRYRALLMVVTATHLKRLFANQDVFNSLDRNVTNMTVSEVDEKEKPHMDTPESSVPASPAGLTAGDIESAELPRLVPPEMEDDGVTPMAVPRKDPFARQSIGGYESDSTISAVKRDSPGRAGPSSRIDSNTSGMDSDVHAFISRLPRRTKPAPR
jgi:1-phosphatidylinositol-3-phosphate 5-kinase